ncbi:hypothetical protein ABT390_07160 [Streptomyces aurantiacus]|nr:hypothetical protein [Streptomyces aurantiacus]
MLDTTPQSDPAPPDERGTAAHECGTAAHERGTADEPRGCLFALSQPPLMIFLAVIGSLLLMASLHDLLLL